jgi:hypothetical protein
VVCEQDFAVERSVEPHVRNVSGTQA